MFNRKQMPVEVFPGRLVCGALKWREILFLLLYVNNRDLKNISALFLDVSWGALHRQQTTVKHFRAVQNQMRTGLW